MGPNETPHTRVRVAGRSRGGAYTRNGAYPRDGTYAGDETYATRGGAYMKRTCTGTHTPRFVRKHLSSLDRHVEDSMLGFADTHSARIVPGEADPCPPFHAS